MKFNTPYCYLKRLDDDEFILHVAMLLDPEVKGLLPIRDKGLEQGPNGKTQRKFEIDLALVDDSNEISPTVQHLTHRFTRNGEDRYVVIVTGADAINQDDNGVIVGDPDGGGSGDYD